MKKYKLTPQDEIDFKEWMEDGNATKIGEDKYLEQTTQYTKEFTLDELRAFFKREFRSDNSYSTGGVSSNYEIIEDADGEYQQGAYFVVDADTDSMLAYFDLKKEASDYLKKVKELGFRNVDPSEFNGQYASFMTDESMYRTGGVSVAHENNEMLRNQISEANHHSKELSSVVSGSTPVEPWVVAKMERATTDLSDVTHYIEGKNKMKNSGTEKMATGKKLEPGKVPRYWNKQVREYMFFVFNTQTNKVWAGNEYQSDAKDELKDFLESNPELPLKVLSKRAITNKRINPLAFENWARTTDQMAQMRGEELPPVVPSMQDSVFIEPYRNKFVLISVQRKNESTPGLRRWANEFFTSKQEAKDFANQNNLKVVAKFDEGGLTIDDMDRLKVMNYLANKYPDYTNDNDWTEGDDDYFDEIFYTMVDDLRERYNLTSEYSGKANDLVEDYMQSNRDVMGLETMATGGKFDEGGMVGDEVVFNRYGDKAMGEITEILADGTFIVHSGMSSRSIDPRDIIEVKKKKKFLGLFDQGGTTEFTNLPLGARINAYYERRDKDLKGNIIEKTPTGYKIETKDYDSFPVTYDMITRVINLPKAPEPAPSRKRFLGLFDQGGSTSPEIHILDKGVKYDKSMYKGVFSDYDDDGLQNLDDPNPTAPGDTKSVEERRITESITQLLNIKEDLDTTMYKAVDDIAKISPKDSVIYARTKTPYSIIAKLIKKRLLTPKDPKKGLTDLIGMTIVVDSYADILKLRKFIESGKKFEVYETEDFYETPLDGYMAVHYILIFKDDKGSLPVELQLKTKRMKAINQISHKAYAQGNLDKDALLNATSLANKADKGDKEAIKSFELMMQDPEAVELSFFKDKAKKYDTGGEIDDNEKEEWTEAGNVRNFGWYQDFKQQTGKTGFGIMQGDKLRTNIYGKPEIFATKEKALFKMSHVPFFKGLSKEEKEKLIIPYMGDKIYAGGGFFMDKNDPMFAIEEIGRLAGLRPIAVAEWGDKNNVNLNAVLTDLKARKITGIDLMGAVVGSGRDKRSKQIIAEYSKKFDGGGTTQSMFSEMPDAGLYEMLNIMIKESGSDKEKNKEAISDITAEIKRRQSPKFDEGGKTDPEFQYNYEVVLSKIDNDGNWNEFDRKSFGDDYSSVLIYANKMNKEGIGVDVYENGLERGWSTTDGMHYFDQGGTLEFREDRIKNYFSSRGFRVIETIEPKKLPKFPIGIILFKDLEDGELREITWNEAEMLTYSVNSKERDRDDILAQSMAYDNENYMDYYFTMFGEGGGVPKIHPRTKQPY